MPIEPESRIYRFKVSKIVFENFGPHAARVMPTPALLINILENSKKKSLAWDQLDKTFTKSNTTLLKLRNLIDILSRV